MEILLHRIVRLYKPSIILMDEATSALDNESEQLIADAIARLKNKKTVIMIAHRTTTIQNADVVVEI